MWADYSKYYFGDFSQTVAAFNGNDIVTDKLDDPAWNYGFTAKNGGSNSSGGGIGAGLGNGMSSMLSGGMGGLLSNPIASKVAGALGSGGGAVGGGAPNGDSQYYFKTITILHFYSQQYDQYTLVNPRIIEWTPDELDYEQSGISMINLQLVYEAVLYAPCTPGAASQPEFQSLFNGQVTEIAGYGNAFNAQAQYSTNPSTTTTGVVESMFNTMLQGGNPVSAIGGIISSTGGLGVYGNFLYSALSSSGSGIAQYGINANAGANGQSSGFNGSGGVFGPAAVDNGAWSTPSSSPLGVSAPQQPATPGAVPPVSTSTTPTTPVAPPNTAASDAAAIQAGIDAAAAARNTPNTAASDAAAIQAGIDQAAAARNSTANAPPASSSSIDTTPSTPDTSTGIAVDDGSS